MLQGFFVTGTDTDSGKTVVSQALIHRLRQEGFDVAGFKPVASGCDMTPDGLRNADALALQAASSRTLPYALVNPYAFAPAVAPHLAAAAEQETIDLSRIRTGIESVGAERVVVEGVGGWLVPLNARETVADLAIGLGLPVILVVGLRLGCLNHALLTGAALAAAGAKVAGWVANRIDPRFELADASIAALKERLGSPLLADFPWAPDRSPEALAELFRFPGA